MPSHICRRSTTLTLWFLGYRAQALVHAHNALGLAHDLSHPFTLAWAHAMGTIVYYMRRDVSAVFEHAEAAVALVTAQGFSIWVAWGTSLRGWALTMQGQGEAGMAQVRQGITSWQATGAALNAPYLCTVLADVSNHLGHPEEGLQGLAEVHILVEHHDECWWEAEIAHLKGVLLLRQPGTPLAKAEALVAARPGRRPSSGGEVVGAAGRREPSPAVAATGLAP